jgi:hypothetical protein
LDVIEQSPDSKKNRLNLAFDLVALEANSQVHGHPGEGDDRLAHQ